jgi:hypothetical protein
VRVFEVLESAGRQRAQPIKLSLLFLDAGDKCGKHLEIIARRRKRFIGIL